MKIKGRAFFALLVLSMLFFAAGCSEKNSPVIATDLTSSRQAVTESVTETMTTSQPNPVTSSTEKMTETTELTTAIKTTAKPKKQNDRFSIKIYTDMNAKSYKSLNKPEMSLKTNIGGVYSDEYMRFVCDADDVLVTLVELSYNDFRGEFDESEPVFSIKTKKGAVYEFKAYLGETMPPAKLKAEKGNYGAEFLLQMNGKDSRTDFTIKSAKKPK